MGKRNQKKPSRNISNSQATQGYFLIGRNACREILRLQPQRVRCVYLAEENDRSTCADIYALVEKDRHRIRTCSKEELTRLSATASHQGVVLELEPPVRHELDSFLDRLTEPGATLIALDSITDPHNVGAILRAAECFGADAVLLPADRAGNVTPAVTSVSVGASELVPVIQVKNLSNALKRCKESTFWVIGACTSERAVALSGFDFPERSVIVLGAEGTGIRRLVKEQCDFEVAIPMFGEIDSLNVSQAAAVMLYQRRMSG